MEHQCHYYASCTNTIGTYECSCDVGFEGDGFNCTGNYAMPIGENYGGYEGHNRDVVKMLASIVYHTISCTYPM